MTAVHVEAERTTMTVTEALAEIATLVKRIDKKRAVTYPVLARQYGLRDPMERDGGSAEFIRRERQGIKALEERIVKLRTAIQAHNLTETISIDNETRTIQEWLNWRREIASGQRTYLDTIRGTLERTRREAAMKQSGAININQQNAADARPTDYLINVDEAELGREIEHLEYVIGTLDGQLSLKNATTTVSI